MRKIAALILCLALLLLCGCSGKVNSDDNSTDVASKKEVELMRNFPKGAFVTTVTVPFQNADWVDVSGDYLYMSVYDRYQADGTDKLISYNIKTCDDRVLFEIPYDKQYENCCIEAVQTDGKWLVWEVCNIMSGHFGSIYVMNIESGEVRRIKEMSSSENSHPVFSNDRVIWSETDYSDDLKESIIRSYDLNSSKASKIAKIKNENVSLAADGDKIVWYTDGEYTVYNCLDAKTKSISTDAKNVRALSLKENKIIADCDNRVTVTDIETKETRKAHLGADSLAVTDDYIASKVSGVVNFIGTDSLTENERLIRYYVNAMGVDGNRLVTVSENEGKYANDDGTLIEQLWVHIYDFDKLTEVK